MYMTEPKLHRGPAASGYIGLLAGFPKTGSVIKEMLQALLVERHTNVMVPRYIREYIAGSCSQIGRDSFCENMHFAAAVAASPHDSLEQLHQEIINSASSSRLEHYAHIVYKRPSTVSTDDIDGLRPYYTEEDVHLVTLIACVTKMLNYYDLALGTQSVIEQEAYARMGERLVSHGYTAL